MKKILLVCIVMMAAIGVAAQTITGPEKVCTDVDHNYSYSDDVEYNSVNWSVTGGSVVSGSGLSRVVRWSASGRVTVTLYWNGVIRSTNTKNVNVLTAGTASGPSVVCAGGTATLSTTGYIVDGTPINWQQSLDGINFTTVAPSGTSVVVSPSATTWYRAIVGSCRASVSNPIKITHQALPVPVFETAPAAVCVGTSGHVYTTQAGMSNYVWNVSSGGTITSGGTSTSNSVTVSWNTTGAKSVAVNFAVNGCYAPSSTVKTVAVKGLPIPAFSSGPTSVCTGSSGNVYTTQSGMNNYAWTLSPGATLTAGGTATSNTATVTWNSSGARYIRVNYTNSIGCTAATPTNLDVTVNPTPAPSFTVNSTSVCVGSTGIVYTTQSGMSNYVWTVSAGGTVTNAAGANSSTALGNSVVVAWSAVGSNTISVSYTSASGCIAAAPAISNVAVNSIPSPSFTVGPTSVCAGAANVYTTQSGMSNYVWSLPEGGTIISGGTSTSNSITVAWSNPGTAGVTVNYTSNGCASQTSAIRSVTVNPTPVPTVTGPAATCVGSSGNIYATQAGGNNYVWTVSGGTITSSLTSISNTVPVNWNSPGTKSIKVNYSNAAGCTATTVASMDVAVNALPTPTFTTAPTTVCSGSVGNIYTTQPGMANYNWVVSSGGSITAGGGPTSNSATISWTTAGAKSVSVSYTNSNGCVAAAPAVANVTVNATPSPGFTAGPVSVCAGSASNTYVTQSGMTNYVWSVSAGGAITAGGTGTSNSVTVTWNSAGTRSVTVNYSSNGCTAAQAATRTVVVLALPSPTFTSGPTSACAGSTGLVYVTQPAMNNYVWTLSEGGTITAGGTGSNTATITWTTPGARTVRVNYANSSGCSAASPTSLGVTVNSLPIPSFIAAPLSACAGTTGHIYSTQPGMSNYTWVASGGTIASGGGTANNSATITWNASGARSVTVSYTNSNGCAVAAPAVANVTVNPLPVPTFLSGPTNACAASTDNVYATQSGMNNYVWIVSPGGVITSGGGSSHNTVKLTWTTAGARSVSVRYSDPNACVASSAVVRNVTVNPLPTPTFVSGPTATCQGTAVYSTQTGMSNYAWNVSTGGTITAGATSSAATIVWKGSGNNSVSVSYAVSGCLAATPAVRNVAVSGTSIGGTISPGIREHYSTTNSGSFNLSGHRGDVLRWEKNNGAGWVTINTTAQEFSYKDISQATAFRSVVKSGVCAEVTSVPAQVNIYLVPELLTNQQYIPYGGAVQLGVSPGYHSHQWYRNDAAIEGATEPSYEAREPGAYKVGATASGATVSGFSQATVIGSALDIVDTDIKTNLHSVTRMLLPDVSPSTSLYTLDADQLQQTISHQDGLGRSFQSIAVGQSPLGSDVIHPSEFDRYGLPTRAYLPYTTSGREGVLRLHALRGDSNGYQGSEQRNYYRTAPGITHDDYPFAVTITSASPLMYVKEQGAPGFDWQPGNGHMLKNALILNEDHQVRLFRPDGTSSEYYPANSLFLTQLTDEDGNRVQTFTDKAGRIILRKVEADGNVEGLSWLETYHVYDELGRIKWQVSPKAVALLDANPSLATDANLAELIFKYSYDERGRLIEKRVPGSWAYAYVYDKFDRLVLTNESQVRPGDWIFNKYDEKGRVAYTGHWDSGSKTQADLQAELNQIDYDSQPWFESEINGEGYTQLTYPMSGSPMVVNYYDHYDFDRDGNNDISYDSTHLEGQDRTANNRTRGLLTGRKTRVIDENGLTSTWLWTAIFYDRFDRPIQVQSNNIQFIGAVDVQTTVYDFVKPLRTRTTHHSAPGIAINIVDRTETDHAGRVLKVYRKIDDDEEQVVAEYDYNELSQLVARKLHARPDGDYTQTVDYSYTISGWLERINNPDEPGDDFFSQKLFYNENLIGAQHQPHWNGGITATTWSEGLVNGNTDQKSFTFNFFRNGQLKDAKYARGANFDKDVEALNEQGLSYDANGNIKSLVRKGATALGLATTIDSLTYSYLDESQNQLFQVRDASGREQGFQNGETGSSKMQYDRAGNLTRDDNKGISNISYNILNKVSRVRFSDGREIRYTYDAGGTKLSMEEYEGATLRRSTRYAGQFVYEGSELKFFGSPEGRVVVNDDAYEFQYAIGDHQGNTRAVFTSRVDSLDFLATFETPASGLRRDTDLFEGSSSYEVSFGAANHTDGGAKVYRMNQSNPVGASLMLRVYPGDELDPQVWAYHENNNGYGTNNIGLSAMIAAVAGSFGGMQGADGGGGLVYETFQEGLGILGLGGNRGTTKPAAYLNYIFFDELPGFDPEHQHDRGLAKAVPDEAYFNKVLVKFDDPIRIVRPGYVYIYLSYENQSTNYVYFDDLKVIYRKSALIQSNSYYAFGMLAPESWTRDDTSPNKYLYNAGSEWNEATGNYEMFFRGYDPALGRMSGVDIAAASYASLSPYNYAFNNPAYWNDPNGADPRSSDRGGYSYASMGGCGCWRDRGPQDYGGEARGANGISSSMSGVYALMRNMAKLPNGLYMFDVTRGYVSNVEYFSDSDIQLLGDETLKRILGLEPAGGEALPGGLESNAAGTRFQGMPYTVSTMPPDNKSSSVQTGAPTSSLDDSNYIVEAIHQGQIDFENHPVGGTLLAFLTGAAMEGIFVSAEAAFFSARVALKASGQGGLNLFKFGSQQATKAAGWKEGDRFLRLANLGTPKLNWAQNAGALRQEMNLGQPIFDSYRLPNGNLIPTRGFLNAERSLLQNRGWTYQPGMGAWVAPRF